MYKLWSEGEARGSKRFFRAKYEFATSEKIQILCEILILCFPAMKLHLTVWQQIFLLILPDAAY